MHVGAAQLGGKIFSRGGEDGGDEHPVRTGSGLDGFDRHGEAVRGANVAPDADGGDVEAWRSAEVCGGEGVRDGERIQDSGEAGIEDTFESEDKKAHGVNDINIVVYDNILFAERSLD